jgi:hypothetical protein
MRDRQGEREGAALPRARTRSPHNSAVRLNLATRPLTSGSCGTKDTWLGTRLPPAAQPASGGGRDGLQLGQRGDQQPEAAAGKVAVNGYSSGGCEIWVRSGFTPTGAIYAKMRIVFAASGCQN